MIEARNSCRSIVLPLIGDNFLVFLVLLLHVFENYAYHARQSWFFFVGFHIQRMIDGSHLEIKTLLIPKRRDKRYFSEKKRSREKKRPSRNKDASVFEEGKSPAGSRKSWLTGYSRAVRDCGRDRRGFWWGFAGGPTRKRVRANIVRKNFLVGGGGTRALPPCFHRVIYFVRTLKARNTGKKRRALNIWISRTRVFRVATLWPGNIILS